LSTLSIFEKKSRVPFQKPLIGKENTKYQPKEDIAGYSIDERALPALTLGKVVVAM
jgi:hypothetical protein